MQLWYNYKLFILKYTFAEQSFISTKVWYLKTQTQGKNIYHVFTLTIYHS
jgi:hypothetical protein